MTDPDLHKKNPADPAQASEPVVSRPYVMPDDPEEGSVEALTKEVAEARDKMLRTLAEMENLRQRTRREVSDAKTYGITGFARNVLEKNGVKKFDPSREKFDPNFQQAMYEVPDPSVPSGTVVQVVQAGYTIGERVLRPALVGVSKGGAKAAANGNEPNNAA